MKFKNPPINELIVGIFFPHNADFLSQHVGLYWHKIKDRYPNSSQKPPIGEIVELPEEFMPLPRYWFYSESETDLIQVQRDGFLLNWRNRGEENGYPHFENCYKNFKHELEIFQNFLKEENLPTIESVKMTELGYINIITTNKYWSDASEAENVFPSLAGVGQLVDNEKGVGGLNSKFRYEINDRLGIEIVLKFGKNQENNEPIFVAEIRAKGISEAASIDNIDAWFEEAHDHLLQVFLNLTNKDIQEEIWIPIK